MPIENDDTRTLSGDVLDTHGKVIATTGGGAPSPEPEPEKKPEQESEDNKQFPSDGKLQRVLRRKILKDIVDKISDDYKKKYRCVEFADNMESLMRAFGVSGERLYIVSNTGRIWSREFGEISKNGLHQAIKIGDTIYDNLYPYGINYQKWMEDLGITEIPYEFKIDKKMIE